MRKALKIIAIIMPFVVFVLFFIPSYTMIHDFRDAVESGSITIEEGSAYHEYNSSMYNVCAGYVSNIDYLVENGDAFLEEQVISNLSSLRTSLACTIVFFIIAVGFSVAIAFFSRKHPLMCCLNIVSSSFFWVWTLAVTDGTLFHPFTFTVSFPHAAFYISLILSAFFLAVFIAYAIKWLKPRLASIPPREHKPTKSERIAELEARVRELENRDSTND